MTIGEDRVRVTFNPGSSNLVDEIKQRTAELIDLCDKQTWTQMSVDAETKRLWSLAMTHYEDAAMWAVKAATAKKD
jgi:hypothetical protein